MDVSKLPDQLSLEEQEGAAWKLLQSIPECREYNEAYAEHARLREIENARKIIAQADGSEYNESPEFAAVKVRWADARDSYEESPEFDAWYELYRKVQDQKRIVEARQLLEEATK